MKENIGINFAKRSLIINGEFYPVTGGDDISKMFYDMDGTQKSVDINDIDISAVDIIDFNRIFSDEGLDSIELKKSETVQAWMGNYDECKCKYFDGKFYGTSAYVEEDILISDEHMKKIVFTVLTSEPKISDSGLNDGVKYRTHVIQI
jgi:hypothetical protein